jgi:hypothetical protein
MSEPTTQEVEEFDDDFDEDMDEDINSEPDNTTNDG